MKLDTLLNQLSYGELSQLAIGEKDGDEWSEENKKKLLVHINAALTAIHKRFFLKERREVVFLEPETYSYTLKATDLIQVEQVLDSQGQEVPLNRIGDPHSVSTPDYKTIQIPPKVEANRQDHLLDKHDSLTVVYRATFQLDNTASDSPPNTVDVDVPDVYLEPLLYYVASRLHNTIGQDGQMITSDIYMRKYEMACQQLINEGYDITGTDPGTKFHSNGWV